VALTGAVLLMTLLALALAPVFALLQLLPPLGAAVYQGRRTVFHLFKGGKGGPGKRVRLKRPAQEKVNSGVVGLHRQGQRRAAARVDIESETETHTARGDEEGDGKFCLAAVHAALPAL
jgi:hypothetical protein